MALQIPSEAQLVQNTRAAVNLLDAMRRYSTRMGGKRYDKSSTAWIYTNHGLLEAASRLERMLNPNRLSIGDNRRGFGVISGWPIATIGEALSWLTLSLGELLKLMQWEPLSEGKGIQYLINPGERRSGRDSADVSNCIYGDTDTWTWPSIGDELEIQLRESVNSLLEYQGLNPVPFPPISGRPAGNGLSSKGGQLNATTPEVELITLKQLSFLTGIAKSTLEKRKDRPKPAKEGKGKGGEHAYRYYDMRSWTLRNFPERSMELPERFSDAAALLQRRESVLAAK